MKTDLEDGLYTARGGTLAKLDFDAEDTTKKLRVSETVFKQVQSVQRQMRQALGGYKPDIALVASAMLVSAAQDPAIADKVREYAKSVFTQAQA